MPLLDQRKVVVMMSVEVISGGNGSGPRTVASFVVSGSAEAFSDKRTVGELMDRATGYAVQDAVALVGAVEANEVRRLT